MWRFGEQKYKSLAVFFREIGVLLTPTREVQDLAIWRPFFASYKAFCLSVIGDLLRLQEEYTATGVILSFLRKLQAFCHSQVTRVWRFFFREIGGLFYAYKRSTRFGDLASCFARGTRRFVASLSFCQ